MIKPLPESVLIPLALNAAASAADARIHKKLLGSGNMTALRVSNNEIKDFIKIVKSIKDSGLLLKGVTQTVQNEVKEQKGGFLSMLLGTLGASLLRNILTGKGMYRTGKGKGINSAGEGGFKSWLWKENGSLTSPHSLTNFEIQKYYQNEPRLNGVYSRDIQPKMKVGAYVINLDVYSDIGTHWVALYVYNNDVTYFDSFGVEHIPNKIKTFINRISPPLCIIKT